MKWMLVWSFKSVLSTKSDILPWVTQYDRVMRLLLFLSLSFISLAATGQRQLYVNTNNLLLRDRPEKRYKVYAVLQARCKVETMPGEKIKVGRFYRVHVIKDDHNIIGWVDTSFLVTSPERVTAACKSDGGEIMIVPLIPAFTSEEHSPNPLNDIHFPYPKYKGGERSFAIAQQKKRVYHPGPRGGCYYLDAKGKKKYVDAKYCK